MDPLYNPAGDAPAWAILWALKWTLWIPVAIVALAMWQDRRRRK